jgi:hypothetical protein
MKNTKWNKPPIIEASLRLQNVLNRLKRVELKQKVDRASGLLKTHVERVKKNNG